MTAVSRKRKIDIQSKDELQTVQDLKDACPLKRVASAIDGDGQGRAHVDDSNTSSIADSFVMHFENVIEEECVKYLDKPAAWPKTAAKISELGHCFFHSPKIVDTSFEGIPNTSIDDMNVRPGLLNRLRGANTLVPGVQLKTTEMLSPFQERIFGAFNSYQDVYYADRTMRNAEAMRLMYCLHALNHAVKSRKRIMCNNAKIRKNEEKLDTRDQGITKPKILVIVPFRDSAFRIVNMLSDLLLTETGLVANKNRFQKEYGPDPMESDQDKSAKPHDFRDTFTGSCDDHFRMGVTVGKNNLQLYSDFYKCDMIIASPLGLRTLIEGEGGNKKDMDFLSSIEMCILDQTDIFHMQNWDHVQHLVENLNIQPKASHGVDICRIRMWNLNGWSKYYRQTIVLSSIQTPLITALFHKHCYNYAGKLQVLKSESDGSTRQIATPLSQIFHKIAVTSHSQAADSRFTFFTTQILPKIRSEALKGALLFVHSYLDFVRLRNYLKKEAIDFVFANEYCQEKSVTRARGLFFHTKVRIMLYTERFHFYRRYRIRGIQHLFFYDLPMYSHFYSELCNFLKDAKNENSHEHHSCTVLYTVYDAHKLAAVLGKKRASDMLSSSKNTHMVVVE